MTQDIIKKNRIGYIDIAKGILICCLLYGHMFLFARKEGINDSAISYLQKGIILYAGFFMQSFFIITGFCSSFNKKFSVFFGSNIKTLLIPAVLLVLFSNYAIDYFFFHKISLQPVFNLTSWVAMGAPWFIITMFVAKLAYWGISRLVTKWQLVLLVILYLTGIALNILDRFPNYLFHRHILLMLPYIYVGQYWRNNKEIIAKWLPYIAMFGIVSITFQLILSQLVSFYYIPTHDFDISINYTFPIHIINAISGTASVLWLSQKIQNNYFLETMGKGTLLIYLWNGLVNRSIIRLLPYPDGGGILQQTVFYAGVYLLELGVFYCLVRIIYDSKYLRWIVGKW